MFVGILSFFIVIIAYMFAHYGALSYFMMERPERYNSIFILAPLNILFFTSDRWAASFISMSLIQALKVSGLMMLITIVIVRFVMIKAAGVNYKILNKSNIGEINTRFVSRKNTSRILMVVSGIAAIVLPVFFYFTTKNPKPEFYINDLVLLGFIFVMSAVYYFVAYKGYEELIDSLEGMLEQRAIKKRDQGGHRKRKKKK